MNILMLIALAGAWPGGSVTTGWTDIDGSSQLVPTVTVLEGDTEHAVIRLSIHGYGMESVSGYTRIDLPEYGWHLDTPAGEPELPYVPVVVGLPAGMEADIRLLESEWIPAGSGLPYPVQPLQYDSDPHVAFAELSDHLEGTYPSAQVNGGPAGTWAGANTAVVEFYPFSWDASTGRFMVAASMTVDVVFTGQGSHQYPVRPGIAAMHRSSIVNYDYLMIPENPAPVTRGDVVYICVVPPENLDTVTPLLQMVNSLGHRVHIELLDEGSTSFQIKSAITDAYQEGITRFALIPARHQQLESKSFGSFVGDFYYECIDYDNLPDIAVGRFPGNWTQLANQTSKAMSYMQYQGSTGQASVPASVILCAHEEDYPGKYTANSNAVKDWDYTLADPVFETCYPPEGGTAEQVQAAINASVGIVNYRGHGSNTTWQWSPGWNAGKIYALENTFFPPVFNVACSNGNHAETYNCLCESWMDAPGVGASGTLGASAPSSTTANNRFQRVLFWELFDEGNTCAGEMFAASQADIIQTQGGAGINNARMYHWFGDPSMDICNSSVDGAPFPLETDAPSALNPGPNNLVLTVTSSGSPVEGAIVTVTDGIGNHPDHTETFYEQAITGSGGQVVLSFTAVEGNDLFYGVRLHNHSSVTGTIEITTQGIEGGSPAEMSLLPVTPAPVRGVATVSFEAPAGTPVELTIVDIAGRTAATVFGDQAPGGLHTIEVNTLNMVPGVYFAVMRAEGFSATERMAIVR